MKKGGNANLGIFWVKSKKKAALRAAFLWMDGWVRLFYEYFLAVDDEDAL